YTTLFRSRDRRHRHHLHQPHAQGDRGLHLGPLRLSGSAGDDGAGWCGRQGRLVGSDAGAGRHESGSRRFPRYRPAAVGVGGIDVRVGSHRRLWRGASGHAGLGRTGGRADLGRTGRRADPGRDAGSAHGSDQGLTRGRRNRSRGGRGARGARGTLGDMDTSPLAPTARSGPTAPHASAAPPAPGAHPAPRPGVVHPAPVLSARGLFMTYGTGGTTTRALDGVDLDVARADSLAVMGPSGCGKTTLLHILAGILTPTSGSVLHDGTDLAGLGDRRRTRLRRSDFGFVFQDGQLLPELTALENVILPRMLAGTSRRAATAEAASWLDRLGLAGMHDRRPTQLSGGQAQRVAIARALAGRPSVVFADEPTGALDQ